MSGWKGLNRVEHMLLMKVVLVGHQHHAHKTTIDRAEAIIREDRWIKVSDKCIVLQVDYVEK